MAKAGQQIDELFISLGLDIAQLQLDFDTAGQTVSGAIAQLNNEASKVKIQMDTDLSKLDGLGNELDKIKVKYDAINQQLDLQRQKEEILQAVLKDAQKNTGANSGATRKAENDLLRQQKTIAETEASLRKLEQARIAAQGTIQLNVDGEKVKTALNNIQDSITRTNAKIQNIRLKAEIDISSLQGVNSALEAEKISARALNQELELQNQKLRQIQNAYNVNQKNYGSNNLSTINAQGNVLKQIQEIEKLKVKIQELNSTKADVKISADTSSVKNTESYIVQGVNRIKKEVDSGVSKINESLSKIGSSAKSALDLRTNWLKSQPVIQSLESGVKRANIELSAVGNYANSGFGKLKEAATKAKSSVTSLIGGVNAVNSAIATGTATMSNALGLFDLSKGAVQAGHDTYMLATRLHSTAGEAGQLKRAFGMVDADATMMIPIFARLGKQMANAGEDGNALTDAMRDYGFTLTDAEGRMLSYSQMLEELAKGYRNAQEAGESTEFISNVLGARGTSLEPLLANYDAIKAASKDVAATGLLDPNAAESAYREFKKLEFEIGQLKSAAGWALLPIAKEIAPELVKGFKSMVGVVADNKEGLKSFGQMTADVFGGMTNLIMGAVVSLGELKKELGELSGSTEAGNILKNAGFDEYLKKGANAGMLIGGMIGGAYGGTKGIAAGGMAGYEIGEGIYSIVGEKYLQLTGEWDYYQEKFKLIEQEKQALKDFEEIKKELGDDWDDGPVTERQKRIAEVQKRLEDEMAQATSQRLKDKLQDIQESTQKSIEAGQAEASAWKNAEKEIAKAIKETRAEAEKANEELKQSIYELTHNDYEISIDKVNTQADEMLNRGADAELVKQQAELMRQRINEDFGRDVLNKMDETYQTELEKRFHAIDEERQAWVKKGADEVQATEWAENEKSKIIRQFENEVAAEIRSIWGTELENRLAQIDTETQAWIQKGLDETYATQLAEAEKAKIIQDFNNNTLSNLYSSWQNELEKRMSQIDREKEAWKKKGVDEATATAWAENEKAKTMKNFENEVVSQVDAIWQTELEKRIRQIEAERDAWIQKGVDEVKATEAAEKAKADARRHAAMNVLKQQAEEYKVYKEQGYGGLLAYKYGELAKAGIDVRDLQMTPQQLENFQRANKVAENSLMPNLMTDAERVQSRQMLDEWYSDYKTNPANSIEIDGKRYMDTYKDQTLIQKETSKGTETVTYNPAEFYQTQSSNLGQSMDRLNSTMTNDNQAYSDLSQRLNDLNTTFTDYANNPPVTYASDGYNQNSQSAPQNVIFELHTDISEAHAWDSEHIQYLADKVADVILPQIKGALNSSNSY